MFQAKTTLSIGAVAGGLAVGVGAFGAHALRSILLASQSLDTYEVAVRYQFYHALALLAIGILMGQRPESRALRRAAFCMTLGMVLFSGSLYVLALAHLGEIGFVTPVGGVLLLTGWGFLLREAVTPRDGPGR